MRPGKKLTAAPAAFPRPIATPVVLATGVLSVTWPVEPQVEQIPLTWTPLTQKVIHPRAALYSPTRWVQVPAVAAVVAVAL